METISYWSIGVAVVMAGITVYSQYKKFKYAKSLAAILRAAKDKVITEAEFQEIADAIKEDHYGSGPIPE